MTEVLVDAIDYHRLRAGVPEHELEGIVHDANVYELGAIRTEWAWCGCDDGRHAVPSDRWRPGMAGQADAGDMGRYLTVHVLRRVVAESPVEVAS